MITQAYEKLKQLNFDNFGTIYIGYIGVPKYGCLSNEMVSSFVEDYFLRTEVIPNELSEVLNELLVIDKDTSRDDVLNLLRKVVNNLNIGRTAEISLVYYEHQIWWLVGFIDGKFTFLNSSTKFVPESEISEVLSILPNYTTYQSMNYVDVIHTIEFVQQTK